MLKDKKALISLIVAIDEELNSNGFIGCFGNELHLYFKDIIPYLDSFSNLDEFQTTSFIFQKFLLKLDMLGTGYLIPPYYFHDLTLEYWSISSKFINTLKSLNN